MLAAVNAVGTGQAARGPGDARICDSLPVEERGEYRKRHPPRHKSRNLNKPELH